MVLAWSRKSYLGPVQIMYICGGPIKTVECIWGNIGACLTVFGHKTAEIHSFCIQLVN